MAPYWEFEAYYDWRYNAVQRQRYGAGGEKLVTKRFVAEGYYPRQRDSKSSAFAS